MRETAREQVQNQCPPGPLMHELLHHKVVVVFWRDAYALKQAKSPANNFFFPQYTYFGGVT